MAGKDWARLAKTAGMLGDIRTEGGWGGLVKQGKAWRVEGKFGDGKGKLGNGWKTLGKAGKGWDRLGKALRRL